jgi:hypothetical protein
MIQEMMRSSCFRRLFSLPLLLVVECYLLVGEADLQEGILQDY